MKLSWEIAWLIAFLLVLSCGIGRRFPLPELAKYNDLYWNRLGVENNAYCTGAVYPKAPKGAHSTVCGCSLIIVGPAGPLVRELECRFDGPSGAQAVRSIRPLILGSEMEK